VTPSIGITVTSATFAATGTTSATIAQVTADPTVSVVGTGFTTLGTKGVIDAGYVAPKQRVTTVPGSTSLSFELVPGDIYARSLSVGAVRNPDSSGGRWFARTTVALTVTSCTPAVRLLVSSSASHTTATQSTTVYRTRATDPGDCNGDAAIDAADITSIVLWIFDGAYKGVTGCDANRDTRVDAGDIACTVLIVFNGPNACSIGGAPRRIGGTAPV